MQSGFNTNVRHRGIVFHVQTEDSGVRNPHVITHLYHHGTILASEKSDYRAQLGAGDVENGVKSLMETQHREMLRRLKTGDFDALIAERLGSADPSSGTESTDVTGSTTQPDSLRERGTSAEPAGPEAGTRPFGQGIVSEKPLDEVVLEYLLDHARKRRRGPK